MSNNNNGTLGGGFSIFDEVNADTESELRSNITSLLDGLGRYGGLNPVYIELGIEDEMRNDTPHYDLNNPSDLKKVLLQGVNDAARFNEVEVNADEVTNMLFDWATTGESNGFFFGRPVCDVYAYTRGLVDTILSSKIADSAKPGSTVTITKDALDEGLFNFNSRNKHSVKPFDRHPFHNVHLWYRMPAAYYVWKLFKQDLDELFDKKYNLDQGFDFDDEDDEEDEFGDDGFDGDIDFDREADKYLAKFQVIRNAIIMNGIDYWKKFVFCDGETLLHDWLCECTDALLRIMHLKDMNVEDSLDFLA